MKKIRTVCCAFLMLCTISAGLGASAVNETAVSGQLWDKADAKIDASSSQVPGVRRILYQETDGDGNIVYSDQAIVLMESIDSGRYIQTRRFGDEDIFDLMANWTDGIVMTPFEDNLKALDWTDTGIREQVDASMCAVYTFEMAYDANLPFYDPNYEESGTIYNWNTDDDTFAGDLQGTIWIDVVTATPVKMRLMSKLTDNGTRGTLTLDQTIRFSTGNDVVHPESIITVGKLSIFAGQKGNFLVKDFIIEEEQLSFWSNAKFARGQLVY
jgi:hypothetical protein